MFNKQSKDQELDEEMESHLQLHIEDRLRLAMSLSEWIVEVSSWEKLPAWDAGFRQFPGVGLE